MKRISFAALIIFAVFLLAACSDNSGEQIVELGNRSIQLENTNFTGTIEEVFLLTTSDRVTTDVYSDSGNVHIVVTDANGIIAYQGRNFVGHASAFTVPADGEHTISITSTGHSGRVLLSWEHYNDDENEIPLTIDGDAPFISVDFSFDIPHIQPAESVQIGIIEFEPGVVYSYYFSVESGNLMIGLRRTPNDGGWLGSGWFNLTSDRQGQWQFDEESTVYVYLISGSGNPEFGEVTNITGRIFRKTEQITPQTELITLNEAVILAMNYAEERSLEWHGNMQETLLVNDYYVHAVMLMNWTNRILYFVNIDVNTGDIISFESTEIGEPWNVYELWQLFRD